MTTGRQLCHIGVERTVFVGLEIEQVGAGAGEFIGRVRADYFFALAEAIDLHGTLTWQRASFQICFCLQESLRG